MSLNLTSYDPNELKRSLIEYVQTKPEFADFNYEGSAINTIIDLLVRNTHYIGYMANMVSTESFLDSAQLRANVVSHAQKLSYTPKSRTASTMVANIVVTPATPATDIIIVCNKGSSFINTVGNVSYSFTNTSDITLIKGNDGKYVVDDVELKQGALLRQRFLYSSAMKFIEIPNKDIDTSTLKVYVRNSVTDAVAVEFKKAGDITSIDTNSQVYYLFESTTGRFTIEFGKNILGADPLEGAVIEIEYVNVEAEHANGLKTIIGATPIAGYSNIALNVTVEAYGGAERSSIEEIKFLAPKIYEAQNRAVRDSDYSTIMLREFPFIKSAIAWGGEKNNPPYYGKVFMCAIPQEGFVIADSVKSIIQKRVAEFSVTGITPEVVDAEFIGLSVNVGILFDVDVNNDTYAQIVSNVKNVVSNYNLKYLNTFDFWYNNSLLGRQIQTAVPSVYSLEIAKTMFIDTPISTGRKFKYSADFMNEIKPASLMITGIVYDINATEQKIIDDGLGKVVMSYVKNGVTEKVNIGTIDYENGIVVFDALLLNTGEMSITTTPVQSNVYTKRNKVVYINDVVVGLLDDRRK